MRAELPESVVVTADEDSPAFAGRYFFHLANGPDTLTDDSGIEVGTIREAKEQALRAIEELRQEDGSTDGDWEGWCLEVTDPFGTVVFAITLTDAHIESYPKPRKKAGQWQSH